MNKIYPSAEAALNGIVRDGRVEHVGTFGVQELDAKRPVTRTTLFRIASMSKAFTALAILKLRDDAKQEAGEKYSLKTFHDTVLRNGVASMAVHRQLLLSDARGAALE